MNKKIMILGASILQLPAIQQAKKMGLSVVVVDMNPNAIGFSEEGIEKEIISTNDIPAVVEAAKKHHINGIMTLASDMPMRTVAVVSEKLGIVGISNETALKATNKYEMRLALQDYGVPIPEFYKISKWNEYEECIKRFQQECIVKPVDNSGSRGIYLVKNVKDEKQIREAFEHSKKNSRNGDILIEEYMTGKEVSVETISYKGVCHVIQITDKITTGMPFFVEMGHSQPSQLLTTIQDEIKKVAGNATKAIGITDGPAHVEIKVTEKGPKIVELGARLGGDNITTHLVPLSTGVDMVKNTIKIALRMSPNFKPLIHKASAIKYFDVPQGILKAVYNIERAKIIPGVIQISIVKNIGDMIGDIESSTDRIGFVITQANTPQEALQICDNVLKIVSFTIE